MNISTFNPEKCSFCLKTGDLNGYGTNRDTLRAYALSVNEFVNI